jgi:hypothetical protein
MNKMTMHIYFWIAIVVVCLIVEIIARIKVAKGETNERYLKLYKKSNNYHIIIELVILAALLYDAFLK